MKMLIFLILLSSGNALAKSRANCSLKNLSSGEKLIEVPRLEVYRSFMAETCAFESEDGKLRLGTALLLGMINLTLKYEGKSINMFDMGIPVNEPIRFNVSSFLPSGDQLVLTCTVYVDPSDAVDVVNCPSSN